MAGASANGTGTSGFIRSHRTARSPLVASRLLYEVAETHAELDSSAIYDAAQRADILWPREPDLQRRQAGCGRRQKIIVPLARAADGSITAIPGQTAFPGQRSQQARSVQFPS